MNATHLSIFTPVELFDFIFRLGVVFAIYGFLWGIIDIIIRILTAQRQRSVGEVYLLKGVKYVFLAAVTVLFCTGGKNTIDIDNTSQIIMAGIILLTYFVGKLQNSQNKNRMFQMMGTMMPKQVNTGFNNKAEVFVIALALVAFAGFFFFPQLADNQLSKWFYGSILDIEDTVFFGFIFKVIGFFFLLSMIAKMVNAVSFILNGGKTPQGPQNPFDQNQDQNDDTGFDDYEEIT